MSADEQRIAIAEALGLTRLEPLRRKTRTGKFADDGVRLVYCVPHHGGASEWADLPNFLGSLDACREIEKALTDYELTLYAAHLYWLCVPTDERFEDHFIALPQAAMLIRATAAQRCEAFLRVKGLWTGGDGE